MPRLRLTYSNVIATVALFLALGGGAWAVTTTRSGHTIHACYSGKSGALHVSRSGHCRHGQHALSWSRTGPRGPAGRTGPAGAAGVAGAPGAAGAAGAAAGAAGRAFEAYFSNPTVPKEIGLTDTTIVSLASLPAGAYSISADLALDNKTDTSGTEVDCSLKAEGDISASGEVVSAGNRLSNIPLSLTHTFSGPGSVTVTCSKAADHTADIDNANLIAVQVASQTRTEQP